MTEDITGVLSVPALDKQKKATVSAAIADWRFVITSIIFVLTLTSLPYIYAYATTPPDKQFMGIMVNVPDHVQYFSWMRELTHANLSANKLTPEPNQPLFFNLLWWSLGRLGALLGLGYAGMFQLLRLVSGVLFLLLAYHICAWFLPNRLMRRTAFLIITFTSGFGWVLVGLKYLWQLPDPPLPLLVYIVEANTFLGIMASPHFIAAALYVFVFDLILRGQANGRLHYALAAGLVALFFGWQHAYDLVLVYGIIGGYGLLLLLRDRRLPMYLVKSGLIVGLISFSPALYSVLLTRLDPLWQEVLAQFDNAGVFTPNPLQLLVLLGPAFMLAVFTFVRQNPLRLRGLDDNQLFLKAWFFFNFLLIYIPTDYQIHMLNGWQIPIAILATQGLFYYVIPFIERLTIQQRWHWSKEDIGRGAIIATMLIVLPTNIYLFAWRFIDLGRREYPYYLHQDELTALKWLENNAASDDVILSSLTIGQYIPALTGAHAFLAHWAQTVDFYHKTAMVEEFFAEDTTDIRHQQVLKQYQVDYIFYGPAEQAIGKYRLADADFLTLVASTSQVKVYAVRDNSLASGVH
jgi:hypothetical protein